MFDKFGIRLWDLYYFLYKNFIASNSWYKYSQRSYADWAQVTGFTSEESSLPPIFSEEIAKVLMMIENQCLGSSFFSTWEILIVLYIHSIAKASKQIQHQSLSFLSFFLNLEPWMRPIFSLSSRLSTSFWDRGFVSYR